VTVVVGINFLDELLDSGDSKRVELLNQFGIKGHADPAGLRVNAKRALEQVIELLADIHVQSGIRVLQGDLVHGLREHLLVLSHSLLNAGFELRPATVRGGVRVLGPGIVQQILNSLVGHKGQHLRPLLLGSEDVLVLDKRLDKVLLDDFQGAANGYETKLGGDSRGEGSKERGELTQRLGVARSLA